MEQTPHRSHDTRQHHDRDTNAESALAIDTRIYDVSRNVQRRTPFSRATIDQHSDWQRARYPWLFEMRPTAEAPDINYRNIVQDDQESIKRLLEDKKMHFEERCLRYRELDSQVELLTLYAYSNWTVKMAEHENGSGDNGKKEFFRRLKEELRIDFEEVRDERMRRLDERRMASLRRDCVREGRKRYYAWWEKRWYEYDEGEGKWCERVVDSEEDGF